MLMVDNDKLENVPIAVHCNMKLIKTIPILIFFNYDANVKFEVAQPICCRLIGFLLL